MMSVFRRLFGFGGAFGRRQPDASPAPALPAPVALPEPLAPEEPTDPYHERWTKLEAMLRDLGTVALPAEPTRRLLFFSTMPQWTDYSLATAVVMVGRGCHVDFAWTPYPDVEDKPLSAVELERLTASAPTAQHPRLRIINLLQVVPADATPEMRRAAEQAAYTDAQYIVRREEIDLTPGSSARAAYEFRLERNLRTLTALATLLAEQRYDAMVTPNGWVLEFGAVYRLAQLAGLPCSTMEVHDRRYRIHAGQTVPVLCQDYEAAWRADEPHAYPPERGRRVQHILSGRATGDWAEYVLRCQSAPPAPAEELLRQVGLEPHKPVALLCANVAHDSVVLGRNRTFTSLADWIRQTIDQFAKRPDRQLVVRAHPAEQVMEPDESVESIVRAHCPNGLPPNVRLVLPNDPVNTYGLMSVAHVGLVHCSTAGLEMAASGLPVIVAGIAHYGHKGFTRDPGTPAEYAEAVDAAFAGPPRTEPRVAEMARCYLDIYFNALPFPFPWVIGNNDDLRDWPVRRVLSAEGEARFGRTFDFLAGLEVPIEERLRTAG